MDFSKVFDILLQPEVTDEQIKEVYDYSKKNQYTEGRFKVYMEDKLGFDLSDKEYKPTESEVKKLGKLLGNFTIREMIQVMENPKYDVKDKKTKKKRKVKKRKGNNKRSNRSNRKKRKSGGADLGNLFKNIKTFPAYKKMYKTLHKILHNYFRIEEIKPNQMKKHILDMKPMQYMGIFNNPKYDMKDSSE
jgi:hypothetical protein|tara:strand:+ start:68 stop:637 length:570 start_codon:yes stop_codon:yes gene_type:complete